MMGWAVGVFYCRGFEGIHIRKRKGKLNQWPRWLFLIIEITVFRFSFYFLWNAIIIIGAIHLICIFAFFKQFQLRPQCSYMIFFKRKYYYLTA